MRTSKKQRKVEKLKCGNFTNEREIAQPLKDIIILRIKDVVIRILLELKRNEYSHLKLIPYSNYQAIKYRTTLKKSFVIRQKVKTFNQTYSTLGKLGYQISDFLAISTVQENMTNFYVVLRWLAIRAYAVCSISFTSSFAYFLRNPNAYAVFIFDTLIYVFMNF